MLKTKKNNENLLKRELHEIALQTKSNREYFAIRMRDNDEKCDRIEGSVDQINQGINEIRKVMFSMAKKLLMLQRVADQFQVELAPVELNEEALSKISAEEMLEIIEESIKDED